MSFGKVALPAISLLLSAGVAEVAIRLGVPVRDVGPAFSAFDPVYGKRLKTGFRGERLTPEFRMQLRTNSLGFRGPEPASFPRRAVLFLGDSFTLGYGVDDGEEYPQQVGRRIAAPVVNAGIGNVGTGRWVKFLRREGARFEPRFVVVQVSANDFPDNRAEGLFELTPSGELTERPVPPQRLGRAAVAAIELVPGLSYSYLAGLAQQAFLSVRRDGGAAPPGSDRLTYRLLEEILLVCRAAGWPVVGLSADLEGARLEQVAELFQRLETPLVAAPHKRDRPDLYYRTDGHWNAAGHEQVARVVAAGLRDAAAAPARGSRSGSPAPPAPAPPRSPAPPVR